MHARHDQYRSRPLNEVLDVRMLLRSGLLAALLATAPVSIGLPSDIDSVWVSKNGGDILLHTEDEERVLVEFRKCDWTRSKYDPRGEFWFLFHRHSGDSFIGLLSGNYFYLAPDDGAALRCRLSREVAEYLARLHRDPYK
jgi:hypothetical protein